MATLRQIVDSALVLRTELDRLEKLQGDRVILQGQRDSAANKIQAVVTEIQQQQQVVDGAKTSLRALVNE